MPEDNYPLVLPEQEIPSDDEIKADENILWRDDALGRKKVADALTNLVRNEKGPLVISIDGDWGVGKTFLLKRWQKQLAIREGHKAIYYNAWEDDFHGDPIISILGQLALLQLKGWNKVMNALIEFGKKVDIGVTIGTEGASINASANIGDAIKSLQTKFERMYDSEREGGDTLKGALAQLSKEAAKGETEDGTVQKTAETEKSLIFIIDELDRCRPTFAIELLERVKHIFNVPNIIFVLGINKSSLDKSVRSIYGDIKADIYLRRFVNMEFIVPKVNPEKYCDHIVARYKSISKNKLPQHLKDIFESLTFWVRHIEFSLRDIEDCFRSSIFVLRNMEDADEAPIALVAMLIALRLKQEDLYRQYVSKDCRGVDIIDHVCTFIYEGEYDHKLTKSLNVLEGSLYAYDRYHIEADGAEWPRDPESLSKRMERLDQASRDHVFAVMDLFYKRINSKNGIKNLSSLIELASIPNWPRIAEDDDELSVS